MERPAIVSRKSWQGHWSPRCAVAGISLSQAIVVTDLRRIFGLLAGPEVWTLCGVEGERPALAFSAVQGPCD
jgi:hypothetical protein